MPKLEFANHGVPGAPGHFVATTWRETELTPGRRELAVFCFGTNDVLLGLPEDDTLDVLEGILDQAEQLQVPVFVIGPPPAGDAQADQKLADLSSVMHQVTALHAAPFLPVCERLGPGSVWHKEASQGDGSHPGSGGYDELTELLRTGGLTEWMLAMASR
jgi:lysophospholipase L1-like esterase